MAIRPNGQKTLSTITQADLAAVTNHQKKFKRLLFSMTVMHAVINQREKFSSFGWTQPYYFSPNDFSISIQMLAEICNPLPNKGNFPDHLMQYLVGTLNYGGKITSDEDQQVLTRIVNTFINREVHEGNQIKVDQSSDDDDAPHVAMYDLVGPSQEPLLSSSLV